MTDSPGSRLRAAREAKFGSAREAAEFLRIVESTLTHHENGTRNIGLAAARRYGRAFGVSAEYLLGLSSESTSIAELDVVGDAGVGVWREGRAKDTAARGKRRSLPVPKIKADVGLRQAVRLIDESANLLVGLGEFAVFELVDAEPLPGSNVVVDRTRNGLTERTVRRLSRKRSGELVLETPTAVQSLLSEISYPSADDEDQIKIVGVVIGKYVSFEG